MKLKSLDDLGDMFKELVWFLPFSFIISSMAISSTTTPNDDKTLTTIGIRRTIVSRMSMPGGNANYKLWIHNKNYLTKEKLYKFHVDCSTNGVHVVQMDPKLVQLEVRNCTFEDEFIIQNMTTTRESYPGANMNFTVYAVKIDPYSTENKGYCFVKGLRKKFFAGLYTLQNVTVPTAVGHKLADKEDPMVPYYGEKIDLKLVYRIHHFEHKPELLKCIESILAGKTRIEVLIDCEFQCESSLGKAKSKQKSLLKGIRDEL